MLTQVTVANDYNAALQNTSHVCDSKSSREQAISINPGNNVHCQCYYNKFNACPTQTETPHSICQRILAAAYKEQVVDLAESSWPPVSSSVFIPLTMIRHKSTSQLSTVGKRIDAVLVKEERIDYDELVHDLHSSTGKLVVIKGRPGSGKSTLVIEISRDWAKGEILHGQLFFFVRLRLLHGIQNLTLLKMLATLFEDLSASGILESLCTHITTQCGENVVFALEGLDEYAGPGSTMNRGFIHKLIAKQCLPNSTVIVTSRPAATQMYEKSASIVIEVVGFTGKQIPDFINRYFSDGKRDEAQGLMSHLERCSNLMNACYLPLHLNILVYVYDENGALPVTETQMYKYFTLLTLLRSINKRMGDDEPMMFMETFDDLPPKDKLVFDKIGKMAFEAIVTMKQSFSLSELNDSKLFKRGSRGSDRETLGLVVVDRRAGVCGQMDVYSFFHLTFQEYLAAVHIAELDSSQQREVILKYRKEKSFSLVWKFVCGTLDYSSNMMAFSLLIYSQPLMRSVYLAYESQQETFCSSVIKYKDTVLRPPTKKQLSLSDCTALGYVVGKAVAANPSRNVAIDFDKTYFTSEGVAAFLEQVALVPLILRIA